MPADERRGASWADKGRDGYRLYKGNAGIKRNNKEENSREEKENEYEIWPGNRRKDSTGQRAAAESGRGFRSSAGRSGFRHGSGRERSGTDAGWHLSGHDAWRRRSGDRRFWAGRAAVFLSAACAWTGTEKEESRPDTCRHSRFARAGGRRGGLGREKRPLFQQFRKGSGGHYQYGSGHRRSDGSLSVWRYPAVGWVNADGQHGVPGLWHGAAVPARKPQEADAWQYGYFRFYGCGFSGGADRGRADGSGSFRGGLYFHLQLSGAEKRLPERLLRGQPGRYRRAAGGYLYPRGAGGAGHGSGKDDCRGVRQAGIWEGFFRRIWGGSGKAEMYRNLDHGTPWKPGNDIWWIWGRCPGQHGECL